jgi:hypothetical protein
MNYLLPGLALNHDPPDLCLLSSYDYRCEPPAPGSTSYFDTDIVCGQGEGAVGVVMICKTQVRAHRKTQS